MGSDNAGLDQLKAAPWDRFAGWDRWPARILLLVVAALPFGVDFYILGRSLLYTQSH